MHYRRMDPQPHPQARLNGFTQAGRLRYDVREPGAGAVADIPEDMPRAQPWQDKQGTWYWRSAPEQAVVLNGECRLYAPSAIHPSWCAYCGRHYNKHGKV